MSYYFTKTVNYSIEEAIKRVKEEVSKFGFGIVSEIKLNEKIKSKLGIEFRNYIILGACNPAYSYRAVQADDKAGTMLPCNFIVQEKGQTVEVSVVDPVASMLAIENETVKAVAEEIKEALKKALSKI